MRLQAEFHSQSHSVGLKVKGTALRGVAPDRSERRGGASTPLPHPRPGPAQPRPARETGGGA